MSRKILTPIDLAGNELQNGVIQNLASAPSTPVKGQIYFNSGDNTLYWYDGTTWQAAKSGAAVSLGAVAPEPTFGSTSADGVATTVSRSDHKHGNPVHDNAAHSAITLNSLAVPTADVAMNGWRLAGVGAPLNPMDAANKQYVDAAAQGLDAKASVKAATTANINLGAPGATIDGVTMTVGDRFLAKNQTAQQDNGIFIFNGAAIASTRTTDMDSWAEVPGAYTWVEQGTVNADTGWVCTSDAGGTLNTTAITWVQFSGAGQIVAGTGMVKTGDTLDVVGGLGLIANVNDMAVNWGPSNGVANTSARSDHNHDATYVPLTRTLTTGAPLGWQGVAGTVDLSANRTITVANFVGSAPGVVPISAGGTMNFLRADGTWAAPPASGGTVTKTAVLVGGATSQVVSHTQGQDCTVAVYRNSSPWDEVECDVEHTSATSVTLRFAVAPAASAYRCVVTG
jgi:hypothetical protein